MFSHRGINRTFQHNLKLASLLSFIAGLVNVAGLFALRRLTTNVTGHFAFFADELSQSNWQLALPFLMFILAFFLGAFASSVAVEFVSRRSSRLMFVIPVTVEIAILAATGLLSADWVSHHENTVATGLLFAMGMQNSLVTQISNSVVRTTHLTGLFTDLGIDLSQLLFHTGSKSRLLLKKNIRLKAVIVLFFLIGGILGGIGFSHTGMLVFILAAAVLSAGLVWDWVRYQFFQIRRQHERRSPN